VPLTADPQLLIDAFIRDAKDEDDPIAWTRAIQKTAMTAVRGGDEYATAVNHAGSSTSWLREVPATVLASICELVLKHLEAEAAAEEADLPGLPGGRIRYADFSSEPSTMG
jgi:hypothetical protein